MSFTQTFEANLLNHIFGGSSLSLPTASTGNYYVALHVGSSAPNLHSGSGFSEPSGGNYARAPIQRSSSGWNSASASGNGRAVSNKASISFPKASADWGTATHFGIYDAQTGGNLLVVGTLSSAKQILNGDTASFSAGALQIILE